jgi:hypothetical protein
LRATKPAIPEQFLPENVGYQVERWQDLWCEWVWTTFRDNPVQSVALGQVFSGTRSHGGMEDLPTIEYSLMLKDGTALKGELPFCYDALTQTWYGFGGLDWHLTQSGRPPSPSNG